MATSSAKGSFDFIWNRKLFTNCDAVSAMGSPIPPTAATASTCRCTIQTGRRRSAPNAMRAAVRFVETFRSGLSCLPILPSHCSSGLLITPHPHNHWSRMPRRRSPGRRTHIASFRPQQRGVVNPRFGDQADERIRLPAALPRIWHSDLEVQQSGTRLPPRGPYWIPTRNVSYSFG